MLQKDGYPSWYRKRGYLHFDLPIGINKAKKIVTNPQSVVSHSFYPLISYTLSADKITKDPKTSKLINKPKERPIAYAAHVDSHIFSYYNKKLSALFEEALKEKDLIDNVLAFRSLGKSNIEFAKDVFNEIVSYGSCGVVCLDVSKFFDTLDHELLKDAWSYVLGDHRLPNDHYAVFKAITKWSMVDRDDLYEKFSISKHNPKSQNRRRICTPKEFREIVRDGDLIQSNNRIGIPQGTPISAMLSNIYMLKFDQEVKSMINDLDGKYYRYCDDMLVIVPVESRKKVAGEIVKLIQDLKLGINTKKTEIRTFEKKDNQLTTDKPLQYLGFLFDGEQVTIRSSALARYSERMKRGVSLAKRTQKKHNKLRRNNGKIPKSLYKRKLYEKFSHLGQRNFIRYGHRAAKIMDSQSIRNQLKPLWLRLKEEIEK